MSDELEVRMYRSPVDMKTTLAVSFHDRLTESLAETVFQRVVGLVAQRYVDENFATIAAKLDQNAIANLAIAEASKKIAEEIQRSPNIIHEKDTQIYQRGVFGGMRRVR